MWTNRVQRLRVVEWIEDLSWWGREPEPAWSDAFKRCLTCRETLHTGAGGGIDVYLRCAPHSRICGHSKDATPLYVCLPRCGHQELLVQGDRGSASNRWTCLRGFTARDRRDRGRRGRGRRSQIAGIVRNPVKAVALHRATAEAPPGETGAALCRVAAAEERDGREIAIPGKIATPGKPEGVGDSGESWCSRLSSWSPSSR